MVKVYREVRISIVTTSQFQALKHQVDVDGINDAVLGFCTLVLSNAKAADKKLKPSDPNSREMSPKSWIAFMPRTEFVTIYKTIKTFFPLCSSPNDSGLFEIFNVLA
jgi:hypothetical protein